MNREEFIEQLKKLLSDISEEERREAIDFYESYFDDAGKEHEAEVIRELGSPGKVAAIIKEDLRSNSNTYGEYSEQGFRDERMADERQMPGNRRSGRGYFADRRQGSGKVVLILILLVLISPFLTGIGGGILGFVVALLVIPFALLLGAGAVMVGLFVAGVAMIGAGIGFCFSSPALGVMSIGIGGILLAAALVLLVLLVQVVAHVLPKLLRKFTDWCGRMLNRGRKERVGS